MIGHHRLFSFAASALAVAVWIAVTAASRDPRVVVSADLGFSFTNIAEKAGLSARTINGAQGANTYLLETTGTGVAAFDYDGDGWLDLFLVNGHVYPEVDHLKAEAAYKQPKVVYRNLRNGRFADVTAQLGAPVTVEKASRGAAFADFDNDGDTDIVVNNVHDTPDLFRLDQTGTRNWIMLKLVGTRSNRSAIGSMVRVVTAGGEQRQEVRGGGSYFSQNDLRLEFGLGDASVVQRVIVRWPNGGEETWTGLATNQLHTLVQGEGSR